MWEEAGKKRRQGVEETWRGGCEAAKRNKESGESGRMPKVGRGELVKTHLFLAFLPVSTPILPVGTSFFGVGTAFLPLGTAFVPVSTPFLGVGTTFVPVGTAFVPQGTTYPPLSPAFSGDQTV